MNHIENEYYIKFMECLEDGFAQLDNNGIILNLNQQLCDILGLPKEELINKRIIDFIERSYINIYSNELKLLKKKTSDKSRIILINKSGKEIECEIHSIQIKDKLNNSRGHFILISDISDKIRIESQMKIQRDFALEINQITILEDLLKFCLEKAILMGDMDCGGIYFAEPGKKVLNLLNHKGLSKIFVEKVSVYDMKAPIIQQISKGDSIFVNYSEIDAAKDDPREMEGLRASAVLPIISQGILIGILNIASHSRDIIEKENRRTLEIIISQIGNAINRIISQDKLKRSEIKFKSIIQQSYEGILLINSKGKIIEWNGAMERIFHITRDEVINKDAWKIQKNFVSGKSLSPEREENMKKTLLSILKNGEILKNSEKNIIEIKHPNEKNKILQESLFMIDVIGENMLCSIFEDITGKLKLKEEQIKSQKMESIGLLAGGIAHDFNNILVAILGNAEILSYQTNLNEEQYQIIKDLHDAALFARKLTKQLLTFSKGGEPIPKSENIIEIVKCSASLVTRGANSVANFSVIGKIPDVYVDAGQMSQVLNNLILNAIQAMPDGGLVDILISTKVLKENNPILLKAGKYVYIEIKDTGVGISDEDKKNIFSPYFTKKQNGTGLGLSTCYSILKRHNGNIGFKSILGTGSQFFLYIPVSKQQNIKEIENIIQDSFTGKRLIIMDDQKSISDLIKKFCRLLKMHCAAVNNGDELLELFIKSKNAGTPYDILLLDLTIPLGKGGQETIKELRKIDPDVIAVVSSGYSEDPVFKNPKKYGFKFVLNKPYTLNEFKEVLSKAFSSENK
jgi:PAS domain S-box-containing protein